MISILVTLLVLALLYWAVMQILTALGIGEPIHTIAKVVFVVLVVFVLLRAFGLVPNLS